MKNEPFSWWFFAYITIIIATLFGVLIGLNIKIDSSQSAILNSDWTKAIVSSLVGATIGALLGAFGAHKINRLEEKNNTDKIKIAFYQETEHILSYLTTYLDAVADAFKKGSIDLHKETLRRPMDIKLDVLQALEIELLKHQKPFTLDQRRLLHNLSYSLNSTYSLEEERLAEVDKLVYSVDSRISIDIMKRLGDIIVSLRKLIDEKEDFSFDSMEKLTRKEKLIQALEFTDLDEKGKEFIESVVN